MLTLQFETKYRPIAKEEKHKYKNMKSKTCTENIKNTTICDLIDIYESKLFGGIFLF